MKTRILVKDGEYRLSKAGVMDAKIDAEELFCFLTGDDKVTLFLKAGEEVSEEVTEKYNELIERRASRIPLQHITGTQDFMGYTFKVTPDVLVPRQDTETLVIEAAKIVREIRAQKDKLPLLKRLKEGRSISVMDLCCGSGAVGIALNKICGGLNVIATDISEEALKIARENAQTIRTEIKFFQGDMFGALDSKQQKERKFDVILSNPPYIKTNMLALLQDEVKLHEPRKALDGGRDGLDFYRIIVKEAANYLKDEGWLIMEIGYDQGEDLRKMIKDDGRYTPAEVIKDLPGKDRVVKCRKI